MSTLSHPARILIAGNDEVLVGTRVSILRSQYQTVAISAHEAMDKLRREPFDLLLVCSSTPFESANRLIHDAHEQFPHLCIVRLLSPDRVLQTRPVAHAVVTIDYHPEAWLNAIRRLLSPGQKTAFA